MRKETVLKVVGTLSVVSVALGSLVLIATPTSESSSLTSRLLESPNSNDAEVEREFNKFTAKYHKSYLTKAEYSARLNAFKNNYNAIKSHNSIQ